MKSWSTLAYALLATAPLAGLCARSPRQSLAQLRAMLRNRRAIRDLQVPEGGHKSTIAPNEPLADTLGIGGDGIVE